MGDDEFMAAVKELTTTAMAYGVSLATDDGGSQLRAALMKADPRAPIGESLAPFVDSLLTLRPLLVDQLRGDDRG